MSEYISNNEEFKDVPLDFRGNIKYSTMISKLCSFNHRSEFILKILGDMLGENNEQQIASREEHKYEIQNTNLSTKKNYILVNTLGYNFTRIVFWLSKKNFYLNS